MKMRYSWIAKSPSVNFPALEIHSVNSMRYDLSTYQNHHSISVTKALTTRDCPGNFLNRYLFGERDLCLHSSNSNLSFISQNYFIYTFLQSHCIFGLHMNMWTLGVQKRCN